MPWDEDRWGGSGGGGGGGGFAGQEVIYVGKHGNDGNDGRSQATAKLTFAAAIAAAVLGLPGIANQYVIVCEDAGQYAETGLNLPTYVHIHAPLAQLQGSGTVLTTNNNNYVRLHQLQVFAGLGIDQTGGTNWIEIDYLALSGAADGIKQASNASTYLKVGLLAVTNGYGLRVTSTTPAVTAFIGELRLAGTGGAGVYQEGGGSFAGRTSIHVTQVRLLVAGSVAFRQALAGNGLRVHAGAIHRNTGIINTTAFDLSSGTICAVVGDLDVATVVNSGINTELDLFVGKMLGALIGAGTHRVTEAGIFPLSRGHVSGATVRWVSTSQLTVGTGGVLSALRDVGDVGNITFNGTLTLNMAVAGPGGLQTGQVEAPSTWYQVCVIADSTGVLPVAGLLIPAGVAFAQAGYNLVRRVGWVRNNSSSNFRRFTCIGRGSFRQYWVDENMLGSSQVLSGGTAVAWTVINCAAAAPPTARSIYFQHNYQPGAIFDDYALRPPGSSVFRGTAPHDIQPQIATAGQDVRGPNWSPCDSSQQVEYETQSGGPLSLGVTGYTDEI